MEQEEKPPDGFMTCVKVSLQHILKHKNVEQPKIGKVVGQVHKIVVHTLQFMKLYLLDCYETTGTLPPINDKFILACIKTCCHKKQENIGRPPKPETVALKSTLQTFYDTHYKQLTCGEPLTYTGLHQILSYCCKDILTMYENNVKQHYVEYVERYVNVVWKKRFIIETIGRVKKSKAERKQTVNAFCAQLRRLKKDLLNVKDAKYKSHASYHKWIREQKQLIVPNKPKFRKEQLAYDIQCAPQDYLPCMVYMMKHVEGEEETISNVFPLRSDIVSKHIKLDTATLVDILFTETTGRSKRKTKSVLQKRQQERLKREEDVENGNAPNPAKKGVNGLKAFFKTKGNLKRYEDKLWSLFFNTKLQCFRKKWYSFHHMIYTDGVSACILLTRKDIAGLKKMERLQKMRKTPSVGKEQYVDELRDTSELQGKTIVAIDPNMSDLLYCVDGDTRGRTQFRYTQDQRRKETKQKKYQKIQQLYKQELVDGKSVVEWETELSLFNKKTLSMETFKEYLQKKNQLNHALLPFYEKRIFRKLKLNGYWNRQRSEQRMLRRFRKLFGSKEETVVCFGDWEQRKHRKYKEPIKGKGFRALFRRNGFRTYLVDEHKTSCKCSNCEGGSCEKFRIGGNPKPQKSSRVLKHGVLMCTTCKALWNRDENSARNIYKIAYNAISNKKRPDYLCRSKVVSGATSVCGLQRSSLPLGKEATQSQNTQS